MIQTKRPTRKQGRESYVRMLYRPRSRYHPDDVADDWDAGAAWALANSPLAQVVVALDLLTEQIADVHQFSPDLAAREPEMGCSVCYSIGLAREALAAAKETMQ